MLQRFLFARKSFAQFARIAIGEIGETKGKTFQKTCRLLDSFGRLGEQPRHFIRAFQMTFRVCCEQKSGALKRRSFANAGDDVGERSPLADVHMRVVDGDQRKSQLMRKLNALMQRRAHAGAIKHAGRKPKATFKRRRKRGREGAILHDDELLPFAMFEQVVEIERAIALLRASVSLRQQAAEAAVRGAVARITENVRGLISEDEARADSELEIAEFFLMCAQKGKRPHHSGKGIAVGYSNPAMAKLEGAGDHFFRMRRPAQEGEIGGCREFGVTGREDDQWVFHSDER